MAKRLGLKATDGMKNYIAKWILTGNPNNVSQEADDFHEAMQKHPHFADRMLTLRETFQEWNDKEEEAQAQACFK